MRLGLVLFGLALVLAMPASASRSQFARIQYVIDGDTVVLANGEHVRLVQIDAPEVQERECYGARARSVLRRLLPPGTTVRVESDPRLDRVDRYGRLLRYVLRGPLNLNLELVREGAATVWFYDHDRGRYAGQLLSAGRAARAARRGLWGACPGTPFDPYHAADTGR
ncbi:MAG: thermonuclease family protein [Verrucomicrobiota bacterium]